MHANSVSYLLLEHLHSLPLACPKDERWTQPAVCSLKQSSRERFAYSCLLSVRSKRETSAFTSEMDTPKLPSVASRVDIQWDTLDRLLYLVTVFSCSRPVSGWGGSQWTESMSPYCEDELESPEPMESQKQWSCTPALWRESELQVSEARLLVGDKIKPTSNKAVRMDKQKLSSDLHICAAAHELSFPNHNSGLWLTT